MYKLVKNIYMGIEEKSVIRDNGDDSFTAIPFDPANTDYQAYLKWVEDGNTPLPAEE